MTISAAGTDARSDQRRWLASFAGLAGGEAGSSAMRLLAIIWIARKLGPERFGLLSVGMAVAGYLVLLGQCGLDIVGTRDLAAHPERTRDYLGWVTALRLVTSASLYVAFAVAVLALPLDRDTSVVLVLLALMVVSQSFDVRWAFIAHQKSAPVAAATLAGAAGFLLGTLAVVRGMDDLTLVAVVVLLADVLMQSVLLVVSRLRFGRWRPRLADRETARSLVRRGIPVAVNRAARTMIITVDVVLVRLLRPEAEVGQYALAGRIVAVGITFIGLYYHTYLPAVARSLHDPTSLVALVRAARRRAWRIGPAAVAVLMLAAGFGVRAIFGRAYDPTIGLVQVMLPALMLLAFTGVWSGILLAYNGQVALAWASAAAVVASLVTNLVLLPTVGAVGASIATLVGEGVQLVMTRAAARRLLRRHGVVLDR